MNCELYGGITLQTIVAAVFFAMQSAVFSLLLEWFYPIRKWKIESDLWHHPRKYLVPLIMLLILLAVLLIFFDSLVYILYISSRL